MTAASANRTSRAETLSRDVRRLLDDLRKLIGQSSISDALALANLYGKIACRNFVGVYEARDIEDALYTRLARVQGDVLSSSKAIRNERVLHVLTVGLETGGHTRVEIGRAHV